uniref:RNase III domain-containing protein n=1 Tax=Globisporangium ultimum (strain ATCC 200006 / CBS 805.95 / DAOM BR144) TaxID=431595 RepID=K3W539_GLOUD
MVATVAKRIRGGVRVHGIRIDAPSSLLGCRLMSQQQQQQQQQQQRSAAGRDFKKASLENNRNADDHHKIQTRVDAKDIAAKPIASECLVRPTLNSDWQVITKDHFKVIPIPKGWEQELEKLQKRIDVRFNDTTHLKCALTHHGAFTHNQVAGEVPAHRLSNRSLEFLGDSILSMAVASYLFQAQPLHQEGQLTQSKSALVNNQTLSKVCVNDLQIHKLILVASDYSLARQSSKSRYVKGRTTIQSGAVESLIAAVYLDKGLETALAFVNTKILPHAIKYATHETVWEPVGALQTLLQANGYGHPVYKHHPAPLNSVVFNVSLVVKGESA